YYGDELTMREVAEVMDVTEGRVSQLHSQAMNRLRTLFRKRYGQDFTM
ncbi:MAG: FliA/WhiG family RNA polymerase sigma factor, partial [Desulfovibrio sp.]|nr:FliA/WhiG family RNA polymerase sigma factor [Desulfovibrio sp.]